MTEQHTRWFSLTKYENHHGDAVWPVVKPTTMRIKLAYLILYTLAHLSTFDYHGNHPKYVAEQRLQRRQLTYERGSMDVNAGPAAGYALEAIRKALMRMPRTVVQSHTARAAVVVALCTVDGIPSLLLEKRAAHLRAHQDEVCLPGGMVCSVSDRTIGSLPVQLGRSSSFGGCGGDAGGLLSGRITTRLETQSDRSFASLYATVGEFVGQVTVVAQGRIGTDILGGTASDLGIDGLHFGSLWQGYSGAQQYQSLKRR
jgi:hypothetical protein